LCYNYEVNLKNKKMKTNIKELQDFVTHQAAEDAVLPAGERSHQEALVSDVLGDEAPNSKSYKELLTLYRTARQAA
jgi:hypothetical protein